jgi:hypothetical protein
VTVGIVVGDGIGAVLTPRHRNSGRIVGCHLSGCSDKEQNEHHRSEQDFLAMHRRERRNAVAHSRPHEMAITINHLYLGQPESSQAKHPPGKARAAKRAGPWRWVGASVSERVEGGS